ncbi:MAG: T9SS type A sorting domain-containing protein [Bacteroidota bacterium]|nr:T9SS type A sorting domain-containing protein [Bacteroidota bacterium]
MKSRLLFFSLLLVSFALAQVPENIQRYRNDAKGNIQNRKKGLLDGNRVRTIFHNDGQVSDWFDGAVGAPHLEWPKGTGHRHLDGYTFMVGAKIKTLSGTIITPIETSYREEMDKNPITGEIWGFEPVAGYTDSLGTTVSISNNKNSWPQVWPSALGLSADWNGEWNGYFGKGAKDGVVETFYVMDDSRDKEFTYSPNNFFPVASDSDRGGLGLRVEVRGMQFQHQILQDIIFWNYEVTNISDNDYDTTAFGMFIDPSVGSVNNDGAVNPALNMVYAWAPTGMGLPDNYKTGYVGISVLYSPNGINNKNISSIYFGMLADKGPTGVWPKNDNVMWSKMTGGFVDTAITNSNISIVIAGNVFNFPRWTSERFDVGMILGNDLSEIIFKKYIAQSIHKNNFVVPDSISQLGNLQLTVQSPTVHSTLSGNISIVWNVGGSVGQAISYVYISSNGGNDWSLLGEDNNNAKSLLWNTSLFPDGILYKIGIMTIAGTGIGYIETDNFITVNNSGNAKPEILIYNPKPQIILAGNYNIIWHGGDADGDSSVVNLFYRLKTESMWTNIVSSISSSVGSYQWNTKNIPNSSANDYELKVEIISNTDTSSVITSGFSITNTFISKPGEPFILSKKAMGTGTINFNIINPLSITGHSYLITFFQKVDLTVAGTITDVNSGEQKLTGIEPLDNNHETKTFDGIRMSIANDKLEPDFAHIGWVSGTSTFPISANFDYLFPTISKRLPYDYQITFSNAIVDTALLEDIPVFIKLPVRFSIKNLSTNKKAYFLVQDVDLSNSLTKGDTIRIIDDYIDMGNFHLVWSLGYGSTQSNIPEPTLGDVYLIKTKKPFAVGDSIIFTTQGLVSVKKINNIIPLDFSLSQNYPNPFNPVTTIQFSIPVENNVELRVYDILGKEIVTLVQERLRAGEYSVKFDGSKYSSGTYFMRLQSGDNVGMKKLMLVK